MDQREQTKKKYLALTKKCEDVCRLLGMEKHQREFNLIHALLSAKGADVVHLANQCETLGARTFGESFSNIGCAIHNMRVQEVVAISQSYQ